MYTLTHFVRSGNSGGGSMVIVLPLYTKDMNKTYNLQLLTKFFFLIVGITGIKRFYGKKLLVGELVHTFMVTIPTAFTPFIKGLLVPTKLFRTFIVPTCSQGWPLKSFCKVVVY